MILRALRLAPSFALGCAFLALVCAAAWSLNG